jgi:hypothetical protein
LSQIFCHSNENVTNTHTHTYIYIYIHIHTYKYILSYKFLPFPFQNQKYLSQSWWVHTWNPSMQKPEAERKQTQGESGLHSETLLKINK